MENVIVTTTEGVPGHDVKAYKGLVWSTTVQTKHIGHDLLAVLKGMAGGEIKGYRKMMNDAKAKAIEQIVMNAHDRGANGIIGLRIESTQILPATMEVTCYGTAVVLSKKR